MHRANYLFDRIVDYGNLRHAFVLARRGKSLIDEVLDYSSKIDSNLLSLHSRLVNGTVDFSSYRSFEITDPKRRLISVAPFENRIVHHAIILILEPVFESNLIYNSYACRKGKGTHRAVLSVHEHCKRSRYFLKMDVRKFFDSVDHKILKCQLEHIIKDRRCLNLLFSIIDGFSTVSGKGLPIGNLTSQFFANHYLSCLDHYILETIGADFYCRYMDDMIILGDSSILLKQKFHAVQVFVSENLSLELKDPVVGKVSSGIPFLGYRITKNGIGRLSRSVVRKKRKSRIIEHLAEKGRIPIDKAIDREQAIWADVGLFHVK